MTTAPAPVANTNGAAAADRSCRNCPGFLDPREQRRVLGSSISAPMCGIKMLPLISPKQGPEAATRALRHTAKNCNKFGTQVNGFDPLRTDAAPDMVVVMDPTARTDNEGTAFPACTACIHYVAPVDVQREYGWTGSICKATGNLMPTGREMNYAKNCGRSIRRRGPAPSNPLSGVILMPTYKAEFGSIDPAALYAQSLDNFIDPTEYPTDKPVTPKQQARGIRAWRKIVDPEGYGPDVYLPIYDSNAAHVVDGAEVPLFEKSLVPQTGDEEHPELYADHGGYLYTMSVLWMVLDETPALWGYGGTGKTEIMRWLSWLMQLPFNRISINPSSEVDELVGKILFENNQTVPHYGQLTEAWRRPGIILLDEPNTGSPEIVQILRPLTDNSRTLRVNQLKGEEFKRHVDCYFGLAMNPAWDPRNVAANTLGDADSSRLMHMFFDYPPKDLEMRIIQERIKLDRRELTANQLESLMRVTADLRESSEKGIFHSTWGVRHNIKVARALPFFPPMKAFKRAVADSLEPSQMQYVLDIVKANFGE